MTGDRPPPYARGYERFTGRIGRTGEESQLGWPRERRARPGAPNIVVVLLDDMGYSDIGPSARRSPPLRWTGSPPPASR